MTAVRGVLQVGGFRGYGELNRMSSDGQRNTLITELVGRTNQSVDYFQSLNDEVLAGAGAVLVMHRQAAIRDDVTLKTMTDDDQRNTLIVELHAQTGVSVTQLQAMSNLDLVLLGLGRRDAYIRGVLQVGGFRRYRELNGMSHDDHRNTLITELVGRTNQRVEHFQSLDDEALAGAGAVLVFLRQARIRDDATLRTMSDDDLRNTLIATMAGHQVGVGHGPGDPPFQALSNLMLVGEALTLNPWILQ